MKSAKKSAKLRAARVLTRPATRLKSSSKGSGFRRTQKRRSNRFKGFTRQRDRQSLRIPSVLFEGDEPGTKSTLGVPKYAHPVQAPDAKEPLPEAYGTQRLKLTPRDPHWIHARWDFNRDQLTAARQQSGSGLLSLRLFHHSTEGRLVSESVVDPGAGRWMVHAPAAAEPYVAELGFYDRKQDWSSLAVADPIRTPPARQSTDTRFEAATLTPEGRLRRHRGSHTLRPPEPVPIPADAQKEGHSSAGFGSVWSAGFGQEPPGGVIGALSSHGVSSWSSVENPGSPSSWMGRPPTDSFRFEVNAELVVYGMTEPGATVLVGEQTVNPDAEGSFRLRFSLPDGTHNLVVTASSPRTGETRRAELRVARRTDTTGEVGRAPRELGLNPPGSENL